MSDSADKYRTFEDLEVYQKAREFRIAMYAVARRLPPFEKNNLVDQIRRAAVSLTNNIAEAHGRFHYLDQIKFCLNSRGSLEELLDDLNVCADETFLRVDEVAVLKEQAWCVHRLLNGYIRYLRTRKTGASLAVAEPAGTYELTADDPDPFRTDQPVNSSTI